MKEHRVRTLRVTTPGNITSREREDAGQAGLQDEPLWGVQLLRLQLQLGPACPDFAHLLGLGDAKVAPRQVAAATQLGRPQQEQQEQQDKPAGPDRRRPPCSICGPAPSPSNGGPGQHRRRPSTSLHRRETRVEPGPSTSAEVEQPECAAVCGSACSCACSCAQPLLHLLSGDLDRGWEDVLLALRLLVAPAASAPVTAARVAVNGVSVEAEAAGAGAGAGLVVRACGREHALRPGAWPRPCWLAGRDAAGHTPLLLVGRRLLAAARWAEAALVAALLLEAGSDANAVNREGRSLLSYAVAALDEAADTTRLLLNHGATVWGGLHDELPPPTLRPPAPAPAPVPAQAVPSSPAPAAPAPCSPVFAWFLRAVIRRRRLDDGCLRTLALVSEAMAERPRHMHGLVLRTMFRHSRCYRVLGPVFLQIKTAMALHWSRPQDLRALCRRAIRRAVGPGRLHQAVPVLGLPRALQDYLLLHA
ncbi:Putative ankyrin repeat protein R841 [Frankliniella fusca]|uniref:Ankyrin repeat protein R841 n=1 Tax=Frankliniella fusca TaxID=407009 RepID=A0AAE1H3D9_9NEOP|nr:Putative ankyrin repeat protein R841 [Frankliniella fusca]